MAKILIVDDEQWSLDALYEALRERGHSWDTARWIKQAEQKLGAGGFDGVILDVIVPLMSIVDYARSGGTAEQDARQAVTAGARFYQTMRSTWPDLAVVIYTVREEQAVRGECPELPFDARFVRKGDEEAEKKAVGVLTKLMGSPAGA